MSRKRINRKRTKRRRINRLVLIVATTLTIVCVAGVNSKEALSHHSDVNTKDASSRYSEEDKLNISNEIEQSDNIILKGILENGKDNPNTYKILENPTLYPDQFLKLASKKSEAIDFVADYPNYKNNTRKSISIKEDYKPGEIPLFIQWDKRWGYNKYGDNFIAINGCGPTALAMVAVGLTGNTNINPMVVANYSEANGYLVGGVGSKWSLMTEGAKNFGVEGREIPLSKSSIIKTLEKGQPIIATMGPGTFTKSGHYIVLTGIDNNGKIIVNDSDSKIRSEKTWDIDVFLKETKNLWAFKTM